VFRLISKAENFKRVLLGKKPQWTPVECPADPRFGDGAYQFVTYQGALPPQEGGYDLWGTRWSEVTNQELPYITAHPVSSLDQLARFNFPDIRDASLWEKASIQVKTNDERLSVGRQVSCLWERLYFLMGVEEALLALVDEPDFASELLARLVERQIAAGSKFVEIGVDAVRISDDYGSQSNLLMSPRTWRDIIHPHLARLVNFYQQAGIPVALHSCGNLKLIMDDLVELGFAAFNIQTDANDLAFYRQRYGKRFRLWGGISTQSVLALGSASEIRYAIREVHQLFGRDGLLILEPDQIVTLPEEKLDTYWQAALELFQRA